MVGMFRPRRLASVALLGALAFGLAACGGEYPNSTFNATTEHNADVLHLWNTLLRWGTIVFIGTEAALIYTIWKFRKRPGVTGEPKQVHGNTVLEIAWTAIPAVILIFIAIPTVRTIFKTQAKASPDALQVEVIGHQWWWEFRYPQYGIVTANELYLPNGRTVNFVLKTVDVLHSFWIPQLGGKRDLVTNRTNYLWYTPKDSLPSSVWNGFCVEYCGTSHANMRFRSYSVTPQEFDQWVAHQRTSAAYPVASGDAAPGTTIPAVPAGAGAPPMLLQAAAQRTQPQARPDSTPAGQGQQQAAPTAAAVPAWTFPLEKLQASFPHTIPSTKLPEGLSYDSTLLAAGDPARGMQAFMQGGCIGCHTIKGNPMAQSPVGPNLTHIASRHTIAAGLYSNTPHHLALWIKNAPVMKPGSKMPTIGKDQYDPILKVNKTMGALTDQQIADVVAYLNALK
jgi:cytochrome c oxidase subunit 2